MTSITVIRPAASRGGLTRVLGRLLHAPAAWQARSRQRFETAQLSDRDLADIGLSRAQLQAELARPFWRA